MSRCVILSAGPVTDPSVLKTYLQRDDVFYAADGGLELAKVLDVQVKVLVGDFDSFAPKNLPFGIQLKRLPVRKDITDTEAAMEQAYSDGFRDFLLLGSTGGRLDHQHAAILLMENYTAKGCHVTMADERNLIYVADRSPVELPDLPGWHFSLFAADETVTGLTIRDASYPLEDYTLSVNDALCVSNEFDGKNVTVSFASGRLLIYLSKD